MIDINAILKSNIPPIEKIEKIYNAAPAAIHTINKTYQAAIRFLNNLRRALYPHNTDLRCAEFKAYLAISGKGTNQPEMRGAPEKRVPILQEFINEAYAIIKKTSSPPQMQASLRDPQNKSYSKNHTAMSKALCRNFAKNGSDASYQHAFE